MTTSYPTTLHPAPAAPRTSGPTTPRPPAAVDGSWRYENRRRSRGMIIVAALVSAVLHLGILLGGGSKPKKPVAVPQKPPLAVLLTLPEVKELEEPEPIVSDDANPVTDMATLVPMQPDLPQIPRPSDFVQQINFTSLIDKPDFKDLSVTVIPDNFRGGRQLAESIGKVFNLADLDRIPEPVLQTAPLYPLALKREGSSGVVKVEFVVDTDGRVLEPFVIETSHSGFNDAAVSAVLKWKFRPGVRGGKKVNTRMAVPIVFELTESE
jgi:protein TonB